jgi:hypothetical protein
MKSSPDQQGDDRPDASGHRLMLGTIVAVGVLVAPIAMMAWLLRTSFKDEDRQHLAELNEEYKELLKQEGRQDW